MEEINLDDNEIGDKGINYLIEAIKVAVSVKDKFWTIKREMPTIESSALHEICSTKSKRSFPWLEFFSIMLWNRVAVEIGKVVKANSQLRGLILAGNKIGESGVMKLVDELRRPSHKR
jgi:hypothetical protein